MKENKGSRERYFAADNDKKYAHLKVLLPAPQGVKSYSPTNGTVAAVLHDFCMAMQSGFAHAGAENAVELHKRMYFAENRPGAMQESRVSVPVASEEK